MVKYERHCLKVKNYQPDERVGKIFPVMANPPQNKKRLKDIIF